MTYNGDGNNTINHNNFGLLTFNPAHAEDSRLQRNPRPVPRLSGGFLLVFDYNFDLLKCYRIEIRGKKELLWARTASLSNVERYTDYKRGQVPVGLPTPQRLVTDKRHLIKRLVLNPANKELGWLLNALVHTPEYVCGRLSLRGNNMALPFINKREMKKLKAKGFSLRKDKTKTLEQYKDYKFTKTNPNPNWTS